MPEQDYGYLRTISLVTQILCLTMVSAFVALRLLVAVRYKRHINVEDGAFLLIIRNLTTLADLGSVLLLIMGIFSGSFCTQL